MRLWSTSRHFNFDLFISFFNLIGRESKIYKRTHESDKKSRLEFNFFADNVFSIDWLFFDDPTGYAHD